MLESFYIIFTKVSMPQQHLKPHNTKPLHNHFEGVCSLLQVNKEIKKRALTYYKKARYRGFLRGRKADVVRGAALYAAARAQGVSLNPSHIAEAANLSVKILRRYVWDLMNLLDLHSTPVHLEKNLDQLVSQLEVSHATRQKATELLTQVRKVGLVKGMKTGSLLGAIIQVACAMTGEFRSLRDIASATATHKSTITTARRILVTSLGLEHPTRTPKR